MKNRKQVSGWVPGVNGNKDPVWTRTAVNAAGTRYWYRIVLLSARQYALYTWSSVDRPRSDLQDFHSSMEGALGRADTLRGECGLKWEDTE